MRRLPLRLMLLLAFVLAAVPAFADWRDDIKVLRVGVLAGANAPYRLAQLEPFRLYLQDKLGLPVEIVPERSYDALVEAQENGRIPYAIHSASSYAAAAAACGCVEAIAVPTAAGGVKGFHAILLARSDGAIRTLADAKGARLALGPPDSVTGYLLPMKGFAKEGIAPKDYFGTVSEMPDERSAIAALLKGEADLAAAWSSLEGDYASGYGFGVLTDMVGSAELSMDEVRVVWRSGLIPFGPHVVRADLPEELRKLLADALIALPEENLTAYDGVDRVGGGGFMTPDAAMFAAVSDLVTPSP
jgi:phosphonate transport system substrate-binding protein